MTWDASLTCKLSLRERGDCSLNGEEGQNIGRQGEAETRDSVIRSQRMFEHFDRGCRRRRIENCPRHARQSVCLLAAVVVHEIISVAVDRHVAGRSRLPLSENHELQRTPKGPTVADETLGPIRNVFATSHVTVNLLLSATSQNLYEWGLFTGSKPAGNMVWLSTSRQ